MLKALKKVFTVGVVVATIFWAVGLAAFVPVANAATFASGDLIKASGAAVYYYGANSKRYVFPDEKTFKTWYANFSSVITITDSELAAIPIGGNVTARPGVKMVKITTDPKVYAVAANGTLRWVKTEAIAIALYGSAWNTMINDVPDSFFVNYTIGADINSASDFTPATVTAAATNINVDKGLSGSGTVPTPGTGGALTISLASDTPASQSVPAGAPAATNVLFTKVKLAAGSSAVVVSKLVVTRSGLSADADIAAVKVWNGATQVDTAQTLNSSHQASFNVNQTIAANSSLTLSITADLMPVVGANYEAKFGIAANADVVSNSSAVSGAPVFGNTMTAINTAVGSITVAQGSAMPAAGATVDLDQTQSFFAVKLTAGSVEDISVKSITFKAGNLSSNNVDDLSNIALINDTTGQTIATLAALADNGDAVYDLSANPLVLAKGTTRELKLNAKVVNGSGRNVAFDISDGVSWLINATGNLYGFGVGYNAIAGVGWTSGTGGVGVATLINQGTVTVSKSTSSPAAGNIARGGTDIKLGSFLYAVKGETVRFGTTVVNITVDDTIPAALVPGACSTVIDNVKLTTSTGTVLAGPVTPILGGGVVTGAANVCVVTFTSSYELPAGDNVVNVTINTTSAIPNNEAVTAAVNNAAFANVRGLTSNRAITVQPVGLATANVQVVKAPVIAAAMGATPIALSNIVAGKVGYYVANIGLDASAGGEDIRVQSITITNIGSSRPVAAGAGQYANVKLINLATNQQVSTTQQPTILPVPADTITFNFNGDELIVAKTTQVTLAVSIEVLGSATPATTQTWQVTALTGTGKASATAATIAPALPTAASPIQNIIASGSLKVTLDADTPIPTQLVASSTNNAVVTYKMQASDEDINITDLFITGVKNAALATAAVKWGSNVLSVDVYLNGTKIGSSLSTDATGIEKLSVTSGTLTISKNTNSVLTVKVNTYDKNNLTSTDGVVDPGFRVGICDGAAANCASRGTAWGAAGGYDIIATGADSGKTLTISCINSTGDDGVSITPGCNGAGAGNIFGGSIMSVHDGLLTVSLNASSPSGLKVAAINQELIRLNLQATNDDINVNAVNFTTSTTCTFAGQTTNTNLKSDTGAITYDTTGAVLAIGAGAFVFGPGSVPLQIAAGTTKVVKIEGDTSGCVNPNTLQIAIEAGANSTNGIQWQASDAIAIEAAAWPGPATKNLPLTGGAMSY